MKASTPVFFLLAVACICSCSKSKSNLKGNDALLASGVWRLRKTDTLRLDAATNILSHQVTTFSSCQDLRSIVYYDDYKYQTFMGCGVVAPPNNLYDGQSWSINGPYLITGYATGPPRGGGLGFVTTDSIVTLTKDSLTLVFVNLFMEGYPTPASYNSYARKAYFYYTH